MICLIFISIYSKLVAMDSVQITEPNETAPSSPNEPVKEFSSYMQEPDSSNQQSTKPEDTKSENPKKKTSHPSHHFSNPTPLEEKEDSSTPNEEEEAKLFDGPVVVQLTPPIPKFEVMLVKIPEEIRPLIEPLPAEITSFFEKGIEQTTLIQSVWKLYLIAMIQIRQRFMSLFIVLSRQVF